MADGAAERRSILVSAYACEPGRGSEPEVGLQVVMTAAAHFDVWVITRTNNVESLNAHLERHPDGSRVRVIGVDLGPLAKAIKRRLGPLGFYWYYGRWQRLAAEAARRLNADVGFDLVHHATLATYWQPTVGPSLALPFVWGPVGGGATTPPGLLWDLGWRGVLRDLVRLVIQRAYELTPTVRRTMASATLALAQNPETAARLKLSSSVVVVPNGVAAAAASLPAPGVRTKDLYMVGRQIPYKAGVLGVRVLAESRHSSSRLVFFGGGPEEARIRRVATRLGVADRVTFAGRLPRSEMIERLSQAGVLLHPAVHDDSPLVVCEALSLGTPVVALDVAGPPVLLAKWPTVPSAVIKPGNRRTTVKRLAKAVDSFLDAPPPIPDAPVTPVETFADSVLVAYKTVLDDG